MKEMLLLETGGGGMAISKCLQWQMLAACPSCPVHVALSWCCSSPLLSSAILFLPQHLPCLLAHPAPYMHLLLILEGSGAVVSRGSYMDSLLSWGSHHCQFFFILNPIYKSIKAEPYVGLRYHYVHAGS